MNEVTEVAALRPAEQLVRAAESIPADILRFLLVAGASAAELASHLRVAEATGRVFPITHHTRFVLRASTPQSWPT